MKKVAKGKKAVKATPIIATKDFKLEDKILYRGCFKVPLRSKIVEIKVSETTGDAKYKIVGLFKWLNANELEHREH